MNKRLWMGFLLLGTVGLSAGCYRPYYWHRGYRHHNYRTVRHHNVRTPCASTGLAVAGNAVLHSAVHQPTPGRALAAAAVGVGLHAAAASHYRRTHTYHTSRPHTYRPRRTHYHARTYTRYEPCRSTHRTYHDPCNEYRYR
jgi:hypothetical protein